jgi:hypothetical protein
LIAGTTLTIIVIYYKLGKKNLLKKKPADQMDTEDVKNILDDPFNDQENKYVKKNSYTHVLTTDETAKKKKAPRLLEQDHSDYFEKKSQDHSQISKSFTLNHLS